MSLKSIIDEIHADIDDVFSKKFTYSGTGKVPHSGDPDLTFERNQEKTGKIIHTCVLYTDIRDSVAMTFRLNAGAMAKVYTAFIKAVIKAGRQHGGSTRNIIGDRVMIVFPSKDCFKNAVDCAISINHISARIRARIGGDFKCGIGIDYGELKVIKVGIQRNGTEQSENKGLVWTGLPANIASRLTDAANKTIEEDYFEVYWYPLNPAKYPWFTMINPIGAPVIDVSKLPDYLPQPVRVEMSVSQFANSVFCYGDGRMDLSGGKLISFQKKIRSTKYPGILVTEAVLNGLKTVRNLVHSPWSEIPHEFKNVSTKVFGANLIWKFDF